MAENKSENAATKATKFCLDQAERAAPKIKNAVDDWQRVFSGLVDVSFKVQKNVLKTAGLETRLVEQLEEAVKSGTEAALKVQKELSDATIDIALKAARSYVDKTEKTQD